MNIQQARVHALDLAVRHHGSGNTPLPVVLDTAQAFSSFIIGDTVPVAPVPLLAQRTPAQEQEWLDCHADPVAFARHCKILTIQKGLTAFEPFPHQEDMLWHCARERRALFVLSRQIGATTALSVFALWKALTCPGHRTAIMAPSLHGAISMLEVLLVICESLPSYLGAKIVRRSKTAIELENGSCIDGFSMSSTARRGRHFDTLLLVELAYVSHSLSDEIWTSLLPVVSQGNIIVASTTHDTDGLFYRIVQQARAIPAGNAFKPMTLPWHVHPERDAAWAEQTRAQLGEATFAREFECQFVTISRDKTK